MENRVPNLDAIQFTVILYWWDTLPMAEKLYAQMKTKIEEMETNGALDAAGIIAIHDPQKFNTAKRMNEFKKKLFRTDKRVLWLVEPEMSKRIMNKAKNFSRELDFQCELLARSSGTGRNLAIIAFDDGASYFHRPDFIKQDTTPTSITKFIGSQTWLPIDYRFSEK
jgi:hypothetical protein